MIKRVFGVFGVIVACEVVLRIAGFGQPLLYKASAAGYEMKPDQAISILGKTTHVNHYGMRGPEVAVAPPPGTLRVLCIGDSVMNGGTQVQDVETVPMILQKTLSSHGRPAEVMNASAGGWATANEAAWLAAHGTFHASEVILEINEKDLDQPFAPASTLAENPSFPTSAPMSAVVAVANRYLLPKIGFSQSLDPGSTVGAFRPENVGQFLASVQAIDDTATHSGALLVILYWDIARPTRDPAVIRARDQFFSFAAHNHIPVVRPNLNIRPDASRLYRDQVHPSAEANLLIARDLAPRV